jgi:hypothetical protein
VKENMFCSLFLKPLSALTAVYYFAGCFHFHTVYWYLTGNFQSQTVGGYCKEHIHCFIIGGGGDVGEGSYVNFVWSFQMCVL